MKVSTTTLMQIAGWGGIIVSTTGFILQRKYVDRIRSCDYYKEALKELRKHPGAKKFLGEPIKDYSFKITDPVNNFWDDNQAQFIVPVSGAVKKGKYYFRAEKSEDKWKIVKAELELNGEPDKRLIIVKKQS